MTDVNQNQNRDDNNYNCCDDNDNKKGDSLYNVDYQMKIDLFIISLIFKQIETT
jgi:hypothetical protein